MRDEFSAHVVRDGEWYLAFCLDVPAGNGQGRTEAAAIKSLRQSIALLREDRREDLLARKP